MDSMLEGLYKEAGRIFEIGIAVYGLMGAYGGLFKARGEKDILFRLRGFAGILFGILVSAITTYLASPVILYGICGASVSGIAYKTLLQRFSGSRQKKNKKEEEDEPSISSTGIGPSHSSFDLSDHAPEKPKEEPEEQESDRPGTDQE